MKRFVAVAALLAMTACSSSSPAKPSSRPPLSSTTTSAPSTARSSEQPTTAATDQQRAALESLYLREMRKILPKNGQTDHQIVLFATGVCEYFDGGDSYLQVLKRLTEVGLNGYKSGQAITYSVLTYCPKHQSQLPG